MCPTGSSNAKSPSFLHLGIELGAIRDSKTSSWLQIFHKIKSRWTNEKDTTLALTAPKPLRHFEVQNPWLTDFALQHDWTKDLIIVQDYCDGGDLAHYIFFKKKSNQLVPEANVIQWLLGYLWQRHEVWEDVGHTWLRTIIIIITASKHFWPEKDHFKENELKSRGAGSSWF